MAIKIDRSAAVAGSNRRPGVYFPDTPDYLVITIYFVSRGKNI